MCSLLASKRQVRPTKPSCSWRPQSNRVLLTEDKDFGWLVYVSKMAARGVILLRCAERDRPGMAQKLVRMVDLHAEELHSSFVVITPDKARFSKLPGLAR